MADGSASKPNSLMDWEKRLEPQVRRYELLGELGITADECAELGSAIGRQLAALGPADTLRVARQYYPCSFVVYLVAQGIYGYEGGDYWGEVCQVTGLPGNYTWRWGQLFLEVLSDLQKPGFPDMPGHPYVSKILAHGGIPDYCLRDFFEKVLQRAVTQPDYGDMTAAELAEELQDLSIGYVTDKPVLRFLQYGGSVAEDFFQRCRDMALGYRETDMVPSHEDLVLPARVVEGYEQWVTEQEGKVPPGRVPPKDRLGLRKPDIVLDPWGAGVSLLLHPQRVPVSLSGANLSWLVKTDHAEFAVPVRVRRSGGYLETTSTQAPLDRPSSTYEVSLQVSGQSKRNWRYPGPDDDHPLLVFRPESGTLIPSDRSLPGGTLWLLFPEDLEAEPQGSAERLERFPRLPGAWANYRGECWDLINSTGFSLGRGEDCILALAVRPDEAALRPCFVGGALFATDHGDSSPIPTYVGSLPSIRILRTGRIETEEELSRWHVGVKNDGPSHPAIDSRVILTDLLPHLEVHERYMDLRLDAKDLLGRGAVGTFVIRIRGPMGRHADLPVRILRPFEITGHEQVYLPSPDRGAPPVNLKVRVGKTTTVECQSDAHDCRVLAVDEEPDEIRTYSIEVSPQAASANLTIITQVSAQQSVHVPLIVPIRRLRWALIGGQEASGASQWTAEVISRPTHALLQATAPSLLMDLPLPGDTEDVQLRLCLLDIENVELQSQQAKPPGRGRRFFRFDLGAYRDTMRASKSPVFHFELRGLAAVQDGALNRLPVLGLTEQFAVLDVELHGHAVDNRMQVELKWSEQVQATHRCARLWPVHRPWERPYEARIPDEAQRKFTFEVPRTNLPSGKYRVEFVILDPWVANAYPQKPRIGAPGTIDVVLGSTDARLREINTQIENQGVQLDHLLERALILRDAGDAAAAASDLDSCFLNLAQGSIPQVLALADALRDEGDSELLEPLRYRMFAPDRAEGLLDALRKGHVSPQRFMDYLAYLPQLSALPIPTLVTLLRVQDPTHSGGAADELIRRSVTEGMEIILGWASQGSLSDDDAVELCRLNPEFAFSFLESRAADPVAHRLLLALSKRELSVVHVVRPGTWIQTNVGWGHIDRMEEHSSGLEVDSFIKSKLEHRLYVTLRPDGDAEPVTIDLQRGSITFPQAEAISTCTKCHSFSTAKRNWDVITNQHDRAVHGGIGPSLVHEEQTTKVLQEWTFSNVPPRNQFA